jgi:glycosyltransferase involved in cell wall biosynthesis
MKYMSSQGFDVTMISSPGNDTDILAKREESKFIAVSMTRVISPGKDFVALIKLIRVLREIKPAIVHTHTPKAGLLGMLAAKVAGVPIRLHTVAGLPLMEANGAKRTVLEIVEKITYACATRVYPNSKNLNNFILNSGFCSLAKVKVLGNGSSNGINTQHFEVNDQLSIKADELRTKHNIKTDDFVFVFIGRVVKDKGIQELVQAFVKLSETFTHVKLLIVGPYEQELDPLSKEIGGIIDNNSHIIHVGYQHDVRPYLAVSTALVFPSYREGFPNVPMQAGCFNLPSIVTNINGCNEIIEEGVNGLIIPVKNASLLENAMRRLIIDKVLFSKLRNNSRRMIIERYEQKHFWALLLAEYKEQLKNNEVVS